MKKLKNFFSWLFKRNNCTLHCECGHETKMEKRVTTNGKISTIYVKYHPFKKIPYCLDCVEKMTIICPWCRRPIFIGDYITLYKPTGSKLQNSEGAVVYTKDPLRLVGCQRSDCAETGAHYCGTWETPGFVKRFPSAIERAMRTGETVIMNF